jgi:hypothetical protein
VKSVSSGLQGNDISRIRLARLKSFDALRQFYSRRRSNTKSTVGPIVVVLLFFILWSPPFVQTTVDLSLGPLGTPRPFLEEPRRRRSLTSGNARVRPLWSIARVAPPPSCSGEVVNRQDGRNGAIRLISTGYLHRAPVYPASSVARTTHGGLVGCGPHPSASSRGPGRGLAFGHARPRARRPHGIFVGPFE